MSVISIIIPVYNAVNDLPRCFDSLLNQSLKDIEIICVNDGSTDNSLSLLNDYALKDDRIRVLDVDNGGPGRARNLAVKEARGKYLLFADSDDWITQDCCETLYNTAEKNELDVLHFQYNNAYSYDDFHISDKARRIPLVDYDKVYSSNDIVDKDFHTFYMWDKLWLRSYFVENDLFNLEGFYYEEVLSIIKMVFTASRYMIINNALYFHCSSESSISGSIPGKKHYLSRIRQMDDTLNYLKSKDCIKSNFALKTISSELKQIMRQPWPGQFRTDLKLLVKRIDTEMKQFLLPENYKLFSKSTFANKTYALFLLPSTLNSIVGNAYRFLRGRIIKIRNKQDIYD